MNTPVSQEQFHELSGKVNEIYTALLGSGISRDGGMVERLINVETKVDELTEFKDRSKWTASFFVATAGVLGFVLDKVIDFLTHK